MLVNQSNLRRDEVLSHKTRLVLREFEDDCFAVSVAGGEVIGLNPVAHRILELVDGKATLETISRTISAEFEIAKEQALIDLLVFATQCVAGGMLERVP